MHGDIGIGPSFFLVFIICSDIILIDRSSVFNFVYCYCVGLTSVGVDVIFPNVEFLYGIPEHAESLTLKSTM